MARANRHYIPGYVWHLTHRCHKKEFLLKFSKDRERWLNWLFEAKKRYGLCILNYCVTSNHIHLLVLDKNRDAIPNSIQLIAGRTAQEFNIRKKRNGAFWEDRYHATAVEEDSHFFKCMTYIDLNMVRTGVVTHPGDWPHCGYSEICVPPKRYSLIDRKELLRIFGNPNSDDFSLAYDKLINEALEEKNYLKKDSRWTDNIAVGSKKFIEEARIKLGIQGEHKKILDNDGIFVLKEPISSYRQAENSFIWNFAE